VRHRQRKAQERGIDGKDFTHDLASRRVRTS
jgi:hypothetical protein